jgi:hypothetical protein
MNRIIGEFRIGEDIAVALDATEGDTAEVTAISAMMKPALATANRLVLDDVASPIAMSVTAQSPASAGWTLTLDSVQTALLSPGVYGIDARIEISGVIEMTDHSAFISLSKATVS